MKKYQFNCITVFLVVFVLVLAVGLLVMIGLAPLEKVQDRQSVSITASASVD